MKRVGRLMEQVLERETLREAFARARAASEPSAMRSHSALVSTKTWPDCRAIWPRGLTRSALTTSSRSSTRKSD